MYVAKETALKLLIGEITCLIIENKTRFQKFKFTENWSLKRKWKNTAQFHKNTQKLILAKPQ